MKTRKSLGILADTIFGTGIAGQAQGAISEVSYDAPH
jgi:hypothetical protein